MGVHFDPCVHSFRLGDTEYLLASEAGEFIMTEDEECFIDLGD